MNPSPANASGGYDGEFGQFFAERLRPVVEKVGTDRRAAMKHALMIAAALFVILATVAYFALASYWRSMQEHGFSYWPLLVLLPLTLAVIAFTLAYILLLRETVKKFRAGFIGGLAEFVNAGVVHESNRGISGDVLQKSGLFEGLGRPVSGRDRFRGGLGDAGYEFAELRVEAANAPEGGGKKAWTGLFYAARFGRAFGQAMHLRSSASGWEGDVGLLPYGLAGKLGELQIRRDADIRASCAGGALFIALLFPGEQADPDAVLDGFDFGNSREFCRQARLCLEWTRELERDPDIWAGSEAEAVRNGD